MGTVVSSGGGVGGCIPWRGEDYYTPCPSVFREVRHQGLRTAMTKTLMTLMEQDSSK